MLFSLVFNILLALNNKCLLFQLEQVNQWRGKRWLKSVMVQTMCYLHLQQLMSSLKIHLFSLHHLMQPSHPIIKQKIYNMMAVWPKCVTYFYRLMTQLQKVPKLCYITLFYVLYKFFLYKIFFLNRNGEFFKNVLHKAGHLSGLYYLH